MLQSYTHRACRTLAAIAACCTVATAAQAMPITYALHGVASGSLDTTHFVGMNFAVTVTADTSAINMLAPGVPCNDPQQATFAIQGIASGTITTPVSVAKNAGWQLLAIARGRCSEAGPMWTNGRNPQFAEYDLASGLGPLALTLPSAPPGISVDTSMGVLALTSVSGLTFEAQAIPAAAQLQLANGTTNVPTLSGGALAALAVAMAGIGAFLARRRLGAG
jgi:exosortase sorting signal-containing protein